MNSRYSPLVWLVLVLVVLSMPACSFSASTANISDAKMASDEEGNNATKTFSSDDTFYCVGKLSNAPDDTTLKSVWTAVDVEGEKPNLKIDEVSVTSGGGQFVFNLTPTTGWPPGEYKVELFLNDEEEPARTLEFRVQ